MPPVTHMLEFGDSMTFHDKAANKAATMGKTSIEFKNAAQKHANATWFFVIVAGIAWYFWGWQFAIVPALIGIFTAFQSISSTMIAERLSKLKSAQGLENPKTTHDTLAIIQDYGEVLEKAAPAPGCAADVSKLPHPKETIKSALTLQR